MTNSINRRTVFVFIVCVSFIAFYCFMWVVRVLISPGSISPKMNVISVSYLNSNTNAYDDVYLSHGDYYLGGFKNTLYTGKGKYFFDNGDQYVGDFEDAMYSGYGKYHFADQSYFIGNWRNNKRHGAGLAVLSNGEIFYGNWVDDHVSGIGYYYQPYENSRTYTMFFRDDIRYYQFITEDADKELEYSSLDDFEYKEYSDILLKILYKKPQLNLVDSDSIKLKIRIPRRQSGLFYDTFDGLYLASDHSFFGRYQYFNDCCFKGKFRNSLIYGHGEMTYSDSVKLEADWRIKGKGNRVKSVTRYFSKQYDVLPGIVDYAKIGSFIKGYKQELYKNYKIYQPAPIINNDSVRIEFNPLHEGTQSECFYGRLDENYHYEFGKYYLNNGDVYYGSFKNSMFSGYGEYIWENKSVMYSGNWKDGKFHGLGIVFIREGKEITMIEALWEQGYLCRIFFLTKNKAVDRGEVEDFVHTIRREPLFHPPLKFRTGKNGR